MLRWRRLRLNDQGAGGERRGVQGGKIAMGPLEGRDDCRIGRPALVGVGTKDAAKPTTQLHA